MRIASVARWHAQHLRVGPLLVGHPEHANGARPHVAARKSGLGEQDEGIERVAVFTQGMGEKAVVEWILSGREEGAIEPNSARVMVHFVFIA